MIFEKRQYFPMLLGNGVDTVLIDWGGSMRSCDKGLEHVERNWYKSDRRDSNAKLMPLFFTSHMLTYNKEQHLVRDSQQDFDPFKAILHTKVKAAGFKVEIDTFLTNDHLLVRHFTFVEVPADDLGTGLELILSRPEEEITDAQYEFRIIDAGSTIEAEYSHIKQRGRAFLTCDSNNCHAEIGFENGSLTWNGAILKVDNIKQGATLSSYCFVGDNQDYPDWEKGAEAVKAKIHKYGYEHILREHLGIWENYHNQSMVKTGDKSTDYLIMLSNYLLKVYQSPVSGATPAGLYPLMWQGKVFWDSFFFHEAMLRGNHIDEAEKLSLFWLKTLPQARKNAALWKQKYGSGEGARYGWCTDHKGVCELITEIKELHNNPIVAIIAWNQFQYTQDKKNLQTLFPVIKEAMDFILTYAVVEKNDRAYIINCEGVDESTRNHNCNDTWTAGAAVAALQALLNAARVLEIKLDKHYSSTLEKLSRGLQDNHNEDGILMSSLNSKSVNFGAMIYLLLPNYPSAAKTMQELWNRQGPEYSLCQIGTPRQDARNVPWFQAWAACIWAHLGGSKAYSYLSQCMRHTSKFGALPEQVRPDGALYKLWMGTAHACFLMAVYRILAEVSDNCIRLGFALPDTWRNVEFSKLRLGNGLLISCSLKQGMLSHLKIINPLDCDVCCNLELGPNIEAGIQKQELNLKAGTVWEY
jgi:hypothetical protein